MSVVNRVTLMGNLGADAELRQTQKQAVLNFRMATSERFKTADGEKKEHTEWHQCTLWGTRGEALADHLTKGTKVLVAGRIRTRQYEKDGVTRHSTEIHIDDLEFVGGKRDDERPNASSGDSRRGQQRGRQQQQKPKWAQEAEADDNDFPEGY